MYWVFVAACRILSCGMWTLNWDMRHLVRWPEIEPRHPVLGAWSLSHWTTREVPQKQTFIFLLFLGGRTYGDHFDQMRKLCLSLNLVKLLDLSKSQFPPLLVLLQSVFITNHSQFFLLETIIIWIEFPLCLRVCSAFASLPNYLGNICLSIFDPPFFFLYALLIYQFIRKDIDEPPRCSLKGSPRQELLSPGNWGGPPSPHVDVFTYLGAPRLFLRSLETLSDGKQAGLGLYWAPNLTWPRRPLLFRK